ncbi:MAG: PorT family protein [Pedobacter sp.]|nr:MAG: PorT family protein [Pedobacter sp.]
MKKILFSLAGLFFILTAKAQNGNSEYGFRLGLTAHPTFGWVKAEGGESGSASMGFSYGVIGDFNFAENYSFSTGLTLTTINGRVTYPILDKNAPISVLAVPADLKYKIQYIELPLTLKLKTSGENVLRGYGQFGLSGGIRISAKERDYQADTERNAGSLISLFRAGLVVGAGAEYAVSKSTSLLIGLSYNNGFTSISRNDDQDIRNHYISLNLGIFF